MKNLSVFSAILICIGLSSSVCSADPVTLNDANSIQPVSVVVNPVEAITSPVTSTPIQEAPPSISDALRPPEKKPVKSLSCPKICRAGPEGVFKHCGCPIQQPEECPEIEPPQCPDEKPCDCPEKSDTSFANPSNKTVINEIGLDDEGVPTSEFEKVILHDGERLVFVGPREFEIFFPEGSFFVDSKNEHPGYYQTKTGVMILKVDTEKTRKLDPKKRHAYKYDIIVNGVVLDPLGIWESDEY